jgi:hypothetical protein
MSRVAVRNHLEGFMENWKKVAVFGALGAGAFLFATRRRPAGLAVAAGGLALLASEYPEKFEEVWDNAPEYVNKGVQIWAALSRITEKLAEEAERRGTAAIHDIREGYGV